MRVIYTKNHCYWPGAFLGITPVSSVSNGLYFLTLRLVSVMRVIYRKIRHARYLYIKRNVEKVWGARYTLGARYKSKNTVIVLNAFLLSGGVELWVVVPLTNSHAVQVTKLKGLTTYHNHGIRLGSNPEFRVRFHNCSPE